MVPMEVSQGRRCWSRARLEKCMEIDQGGPRGKAGVGILVTQWTIQRHGGGGGERKREGIKRERQISGARRLSEHSKL